MLVILFNLIMVVVILFNLIMVVVIYSYNASYII